MGTGRAGAGWLRSPSETIAGNCRSDPSGQPGSGALGGEGPGRGRADRPEDDGFAAPDFHWDRGGFLPGEGPRTEPGRPGKAITESGGVRGRLQRAVLHVRARDLRREPPPTQRGGRAWQSPLLSGQARLRGAGWGCTGIPRSMRKIITTVIVRVQLLTYIISSGHVTPWGGGAGPS